MFVLRMTWYDSSVILGMILFPIMLAYMFYVIWITNINQLIIHNSFVSSIVITYYFDTFNCIRLQYIILI